MHSLISLFVVHCLHSIIHVLKVAKSKFPRLLLVSVAEQVGLNHTWSQTLEDRFSSDKARSSYPQSSQDHGPEPGSHISSSVFPLFLVSWLVVMRTCAE